MQRILLTGGRAPVALDLARRLARAGQRVFLAESQWPNLTSSSRFVERHYRVPPPKRDPAAFARAIGVIVKREQIDLIIPTCEEVFYLARFRDQLPVYSDSLDSLRVLHNKWEFMHLVRELGALAPRTWLLGHFSMLKGFFPAPQSIVLKPVYSRFASKTRVIASGNSFSQSLNISPDKPWLAQSQIIGEELCSYSVAQQGKILAHATYRPLLRAGLGAGVAFEAIEHLPTLGFARKVVEKLNFTGQIAFDFIEASDGLYVLECNPRATSAIHLFGEQDPLVAALLNEHPGCFVLPAGQSAQIKLAMVLYALPQWRNGGFEHWRGIFGSAKDVIHDPKDPKPSSHQVWCALSLLWQSQMRGISPLELSTADIEWDGQEL
jgi:predicted ATP-grasp superfamily ATP-dependent carboligase